MPPQLTAITFTGMVGCALLLGAATPQAADPWLTRYDLRATAGDRHALPRPLAEISGLAFDEGGRLFAHNDELARIYQVDPATGAIVRTIAVGPAGTRGDFEGLAIVGRRFFLMTSGGTLLDFQEPEGRASAQFRRVDTGLGAHCELEGLAYDRAAEALLASCKTPRAKALEDHVVVFALPLATLVPDPKPRVLLPASSLPAAGLARGFHPSSIEVHPRSGSLFLISAQEETIVELGRDGRVLATQRLPRSLHPQPEGIAFSPDLRLWIGDEGGQGRGSLTRYALRAGG